MNRLPKKKDAEEIRTVFFGVDKKDHAVLVAHRNKMRREYCQVTYSAVLERGVGILRRELEKRGVELPTLEVLPTQRGRRNRSKPVAIIKTSFTMSAADVDFMYRYIAYRLAEQPDYIKRHFIRDVVGALERGR